MNFLIKPLRKREDLGLSNMKQLVVLVGPPGSGKSNLRYELLEKDTSLNGITYISQDEQGKDGHKQNFKLALNEGINIIVDRMNFNKEQRARYLNPAKELGYKTKIIVLQTSRQLCFERMGSRKDHPTIKDFETAKKAMNTFMKAYERPTPDEADEIEFIQCNTNSSDQRDLNKNKFGAIIIDLDGTMANCDHRLHFIRPETPYTIEEYDAGSVRVYEKKPKPDWKAFFEGIEKDSVNEWCRELALAFHHQGFKIVYASGRPEDYREATENWLKKNKLDLGPLFMRAKGDYRQDYFAKETILDFCIEPNYKPILFIDDRQQVIDLWRKRGYTALQCQPGKF